MHPLRGSRGPASAVTDNMYSTIRELHQDGHCVAHIARVLSVPVKALYPVMGRLGLVVTRHARRSGLSSTQLHEMAAAYVAGEGTKSLAARYGVTDGTVARYLREAGIELRPAGFQEAEGHHDWKGGRVETEQGYVRVRVYPDDPFYGMGVRNAVRNQYDKSFYVLEHRLVMARHRGRLLTEEETVHHIDGNKENNDISNLQLRQGRHGNGSAFQCADCGSYNIIPAPLSSAAEH
jgi:hypothetical protein